MFRRILTIFVLLIWCLPVFAQEPVLTELKIAGGSSSGIYEQFIKEIQEQVKDDISLVAVQSKSAIENLEHLVGNDANLALMHSDVLFYRNMTDSENLAHLRTLLALFPEDVNIVALSRPYKVPKANAFDFSNRTIPLESITDLVGLPIGTAGGGFITSNVIRAQGGIDWNIVKYDNGQQALAALRDGQVAAVVLVGAAPLPLLKDLNGDYKLLAVGDTTLDRLKAVYRRDTVFYNNISPTPVQTIAADCLLVTRNYKSPKVVGALLKLREAVWAHLDDLKETTGYHKAWQKVDKDNRGKWAWFTGSQESATSNY